MTHQHSIPTTDRCDHPANELIEAVAFGFATDTEAMMVQEHIATCAICREAWEHATLAATTLPLTAPDPPYDLPETVWAGIEARIAPAPVPLASPVVALPTRRVSWAVAAMLAVFTLAAGLVVGWLLFDRANTDPATAPEIALSDPATGATGTVRYLPDQGVIVLHMDDMPAAPEGQVYQVWMIEGDTPTPVGVFDAASGEFAAAGNPADFDAMAITVEPGPIGGALPTTDPVMVIDLATLIAE